MEELDLSETEIGLTLDLTRNRLTRMDMTFQVMTFAVGVGALVAGLFGMNLHNGHENDDGDEHGNGWFTAVTGITVAAVVLLAAVAWGYASRDTRQLT